MVLDVVWSGVGAAEVEADACGVCGVVGVGLPDGVAGVGVVGGWVGCSFLLFVKAAVAGAPGLAVIFTGVESSWWPSGALVSVAVYEVPVRAATGSLVVAVPSLPVVRVTGLPSPLAGVMLMTAPASGLPLVLSVLVTVRSAGLKGSTMVSFAVWPGVTMTSCSGARSWIGLPVAVSLRRQTPGATPSNRRMPSVLVLPVRALVPLRVSSRENSAPARRAPPGSFLMISTVPGCGSGASAQAVEAPSRVPATRAAATPTAAGAYRSVVLGRIEGVISLIVGGGAGWCQGAAVSGSGQTPGAWKQGWADSGGPVRVPEREARAGRSA